MKEIICHDCKHVFLKGERYIPYTIGIEMYAKCEKCFKDDSILRDFQKTEVYSRVVGYIRPVQQWNKGKQSEFNDRREYITEYN